MFDDDPDEVMLDDDWTKMDVDDCPYGEARCSWPECDCYDDVDSDVEDLSEIVKRFNIE